MSGSAWTRHLCNPRGKEAKKVDLRVFADTFWEPKILCQFLSFEYVKSSDYQLDATDTTDRFAKSFVGYRDLVAAGGKAIV